MGDRWRPAGLVVVALLGCGGSTVGAIEGDAGVGGSTADASFDVVAADAGESSDRGGDADASDDGDATAPPAMDATAEPTPWDSGGDDATTVPDATAFDAPTTSDAPVESDAAPIVTAIDVTPIVLNLDFPCDTPGQLHATASYSDGTMADVTAQATWTSSNPTEATAGPGGFISCAPTATGGAVTISSTFGGATGTSTVVCDGPVISAAAITPQDASAPVGGLVQFNAVITFSDGTKCDSTANAFWQTGDPSVATIATGASAGGLATAHAVGSTLVQAAIHGVQAPPATLVVTAVTDGGSGDDAAISDASAPDGGSPVTSIVVLPSNPSLPLDCPQQMTAVAQHADGTTNDATTASTWSSSPTGIVAIDPTGFLHCSAVGTTEVSASCGGRTGQTAVTCTATTLVSLNVVPPDAAIAVGSTLQYAANGLYSSGQECDLTRAAQWQSSSASVASIVTGTPDAGLATALEAGTTQISAASGAITGTATLTVQ